MSTSNPVRKPCPVEGTGVHKWVFYAAHMCIAGGMADEEAVPLIEGMMTRSPSPSDEVESSVAIASEGNPSC